jgi:plasmid maintenance system killer protein
MKRFIDAKTQQVYETGFAIGIPECVSLRAHKVIRLLLAACDWQDVGVQGSMVRWRNAPDRNGLLVHGKWYVTFAWSNDFGAYGVVLERR